MKLIDKDALVAEIERRIESCAKQREDMLNVQCHTLADDASARMGELRCFQDFLDTLEVKEVDLEKEWKKFLKDGDVGFKEIAIHFFELGVLCPINNINIEEVKAAAKVWSEDDENTRGCDYIGAVVAERAFVACAEWLINKAQKGEEV